MTNEQTTNSDILKIEIDRDHRDVEASDMPLFGPRSVQRDGLEVVYRAQGMLEAKAVKGRLEASGIPALLDYESLGPTLGITIDGLGEVRVMVPIDRADDARELLRSPLAGEDDEADREPD